MELIENKRVSACLSGELNHKFSHLWQMVGNTPMAELRYIYRNKPGRIFVKCEYYNLTESIKDRIALYSLFHAYRNCEIKPTEACIIY